MIFQLGLLPFMVMVHPPCGVGAAVSVVRLLSQGTFVKVPGYPCTKQPLMHMGDLTPQVSLVIWIVGERGRRTLGHPSRPRHGRGGTDPRPGPCAQTKWMLHQ